MWVYVTPFTLFLVIHIAFQAAEEVPRNQDNIIACSDTCHPHDCSDVAAQDLRTDGVYLIYPGGITTPVPVHCDMTGKDGPWTVFQKRFDGKVNFYRGWTNYKAGFGNANGEYWLGLQNIFLLTLKKSYRLRIDLVDWDNITYYVTYDNFSLSRMAVDPEEDGYKLYLEKFTEGDPARPAGNALSGHVGLNFSTFDNDRDAYIGNCAASYHGGFWYGRCHGANLNGKYQNGTTTEYATGVVWHTGKGYYYSYKKTAMKIAPYVSDGSIRPYKNQ